MDAADRLDLANPAEMELAEEYLAIKRRISEGRVRADRLRRLAEHVEDQAEADEHILRELDGAPGMRDSCRSSNSTTRLRAAPTPAELAMTLGFALTFATCHSSELRSCRR